MCVWHTACNAPENAAISPPAAPCAPICDTMDCPLFPLAYTNGVLHVFLQFMSCNFLLFPLFSSSSFIRLFQSTSKTLGHLQNTQENKRFLLSRRLWTWVRKQTIIHSMFPAAEMLGRHERLHGELSRGGKPWSKPELGISGRHSRRYSSYFCATNIYVELTQDLGNILSPVPTLPPWGRDYNSFWQARKPRQRSQWLAQVGGRGRVWA